MEGSTQKTVIITGANGNLGTAVTRHFLAQGYRVLATVISEDAKKDLPSHPHLQVTAVDLSDEAAAGRFVTACTKEGPVSCALLLVGGFFMGGLDTTGLSDIRSQITLNFDTAYNMARPLFAHMMDNNSGRIIFIGARPALKAVDGKNMIAYGLSKSLLFKLAEYINAAAKGKDVTATVIAPSTLDTPANRKSMPDADPEKWVKPESLAAILSFLCSENAGPLRETVLKVYNNA